MRKAYTIYSIISFAFVTLIIGGFYIAYHNGYIKLNHPSPKDYPVHGIDISHHQREIDWNRLDKDLVQFAFIKATEGGDHKDTLFEQNRLQAQKLHIPVGAYHFYSFCKSGEEQARNFIETVPKDSTNLPPVIDLEFGGNCKQTPNKENLLKEVEQFIEILEDYYQKKVIIYSTHEFYNAYLIDLFRDNPVWIRDIINTPSLKDGRQWLFWQYYNRGRLEGIDKPVDLNVFRGTKEEFETLLR